MEKRRSRYQTLRWQLARERIGQLVRANYRADQEMSPRLAALVRVPNYFEDERERRLAAELLIKDEARRIAVNVLSTHMADIDIALR